MTYVTDSYQRAFVGLFLALTLLNSPAGASQWTDPDWKTALSKSDMIVLAEVDTGGPNHARVRAIKSYWGIAPNEPFWIDGFNDNQANALSIELGSLNKGQLCYLFLVKHPSVPVRVTDQQERQALHNNELRAYVDAKRNNRVYSTWTPTSGCLRVCDGKVNYTLFTTTYSQFRGPARSAAEFEAFLRAAVAASRRGKQDCDFLNRCRQQLLNANKPRFQHDLSHMLLTIHLAGETQYHEVYERLSRHATPDVRVAAARLFGQVDGKAAHDHLKALATDQDRAVRAEAIRQLSKQPRDDVGPFFVSQLEKTTSGSDGSKPLMDPVLDCSDNPTVELIRALGELKYTPALPHILPFLKSDDRQLIIESVTAIDRFGSRAFVPYLEAHLKGRNPDVLPIVIQIARHYRLRDMKAGLETLVTHPIADRPYLWADCIEALGDIGDAGSGNVLMGVLREHLRKARASDDDAVIMTAIIGALAKLNHSPAKDTVYETVFFWFGVDDIMVGNSQLIALKEELEQRMEAKAVDSMRNIEKTKIKCLVFVTNRKALLGKYRVEPVYKCLVQLEINEVLAFDDKVVSESRNLVAKALGIPLENIGLIWKTNEQTTTVVDIDARMAARPAPFLCTNVCRFLREGRVEKDRHFVRWLIGRGLVEKAFVKELMPEIME